MGHKKKQGSSSAAAAMMESGMGKMKEKQMEKVRDGRKEKQNGREHRKEGREDAREGDAMAAGQKFFKVFFPEQSAERLKIPPAFQEYLEEEPNRQVSLKSPSGKTWQVVLTSDSQGLYFTKGWKEFANDHSLVPGHFLVFTYDGCSQFSLMVFCALGVEDKSALDVQPFQEVLVEQADVTENGTAPKRHTGFQKKPEKSMPEATIGTFNEAPTDINSYEDSSYLLNEYSCGNKTWIRSMDVPRMGQFVSKKIRQPVVTSQRRPVTEEEKNHALKRAKEFNSKNPFTVQVMMESHVYVGFFLNIPCEFVRESLPRTCKKMKLWDPRGRSWDVTYQYYNDRSVAAFTGGWGRFATANNLEKFDVCVFELFKEDNINVHIYRVVTEIARSSVTAACDKV